MFRPRAMVICFAVVLAAAILFCRPADSIEDAKQDDEPIICNGDKIEYIEGTRRLSGSGNTSIVYEDMKLTSDRIEVNLQTKEAVAEGNVVLTQGKSVFKAERIIYNFLNKTGRLIKGRMEAPPWYGECDNINKTADKEYTLGVGYISTCDRIPPHYKIRTKNVKVYLDSKVVAKNVVVCAGSVPVMYLPIYTHDMKSKKPMIAVVPGHSKEWGYYNLTAVRYNISDTQQGNIHMDLRSNKGFASGITHSYGLGRDSFSLGKGVFDVYYMNEDDRNKPESSRREIQRYRTQVRHRWQLDAGTLFLAEYNRLSDAGFIKDYFYRQEYINQIQPNTYVYLLRQEPGYSSGFFCQKRVNSFFSQTEYLPEFRVDLNQQRLVENLPIFYKGQYSAANLTKKNANTDTDYDTNRFDSYNELSYVFSPFGLVSFNPYAATRQSFYSKGALGDSDTTRGIFYSGIDTSMKFYRNYDLDNVSFLGTQLNALRHIVTPLARYKYTHTPTLAKDKLTNFDDIDTIGYENALTLSLENNFQAKTAVRAGDGQAGAYDTFDLARFVISTDYDFRKTPGSEFTNLIGDFELSPSRFFLIESDTSFNPHSQKFDIINVDFMAKQDDAKKLGLGHRYQRGENNQLTFDALYPVTGKIGLHCYQRYQFRDNKIEEQEYGISYDLHCWIMDLNLNSGAGSTIWVIFKLKAFPDFPIQLGSTYEQPKPEMVGN